MGLGEQAAISYFDYLNEELKQQQVLQEEFEYNHRKTSVLWRRLDPLPEESEELKSCRIVSAKLEQADKLDGPQTKRRRLTLLGDSETSIRHISSLPLMPPRKSALKVLDPLTRMVDDSLQLVHQGARLVEEHYRLITTDPALSSKSNDIQKWLLWCHSEGGNLLHACALWNDVDMAAHILHTYSKLTGKLCEALDGDKRTPYESAQLAGHHSVCEVLEAFGGDTSNYVHDIFCLEEGEEGITEMEPRDQAYAPTPVELTSGVAFWTPDGELILEPSGKLHFDLQDEEASDIDSNCEVYDANDYPEEEEEDGAIWGYDDSVDMYQQYQMQDSDGELDSYALEEMLVQRKIKPAFGAEDNDADVCVSEDASVEY